MALAKQLSIFEIYYHNKYKSIWIPGKDMVGFMLEDMGWNSRLTLGQITKSKPLGFNGVVSQMIIGGLNNYLCVLLIQPAIELVCIKKI